MTLIELVKILNQLSRDHGKRIVTLRELAIWGRVTQASAGMSLLRAQKKGLVFRVKNLWGNRLDPPSLIELALALHTPSYLSFESALYHHHILSQSPRGALTLATRGRPQRIETPLGTIQFIHLKPDLFFGYDADRIATPEKAWLDLLYTRGLKGRRHLLSEKFYLKVLNPERLRALEKKFPSWVRSIH